MTIRERFSRSFFGAIVALVVFSGSPAEMIANAAQGDPLIDLAALAIRPSDVDQPGFGQWIGVACGSPAGCGSTLFAVSGPDEETLSNAKLRRGYRSQLVDTESYDAGESSDQIETTILEFADSAKAKAKAGLGIVLGPLAQQAAPIPTTIDIVDGAETIVVLGAIGDDSDIAGAAGVRFRIGRLVVSVDYHFATGNEVDPVVAESLAQIVADRIKNGQLGANLGAMVVHHTEYADDSHEMVDGRFELSLVSLFQPAGDQASQFETDNVTDAFSSTQWIIQTQRFVPDLVLKISLMKFDDEDSASAYLATAVEGDIESFPAHKEVTESHPLLDESHAYIVAAADVYAVMHYLRLGSITAVIMWFRPFPDVVSPQEQLAVAESQVYAAAAFTAEAQASCLTAGECRGIIPIPAELMPQL